MWYASIRRLLCVAALASFAVPAFADPPARVGRIAYLDGNAQFYADREQGWQAAQLNYPVTSENSLWIDGPGRAEVRIGGSALRIADDTVVDFLSIDDERVEAFLQRGTASIRLRPYGSLGISELFQIETSEGQFQLDPGGRYRIDAAADAGETRLTVLDGRARYENGDTRLTVERGKVLTVRMQGSATDFRFDNAVEVPLDRWAAARDQQWDQTHTRITRESVVSPYMTGYEDLDEYGEWFNDAEYGRVWAPRVVVSGWAPYRYGRWSYVRPWGWTWVDDAPWGFAPFHYGRWVQVRSRWCWTPGTYQARPVYAPALVAWFGSAGGGLSISSGPSVGWFPLAPREYFVPRYSHSPNYVRRINHVTNNNITINPPSNYRNHIPGATMVPNTTFMNGNPVGANRVQLAPRDIARQRPISHFDAVPGSRRNPPSDMPDRSQANSPRPRFPAPGAASPPPYVAPRASGPVPPVEKRRPEPVRIGPLPVQKVTPDAGRGGALPSEPSPATAPRPRPLPPVTAAPPGGIPAAPAVGSRPPPGEREPRTVQPPRQIVRPPQGETARTLPPPGGIPAAPRAPQRPAGIEQGIAVPKPVPVPAPERVNKPRVEVRQEPREKDGDGPNRPKKD